MAQYKVPQDVEADDKLIGPFSFRQFVYLMITAGLGGLAFLLFRVFPLLAIIPAPFMMFFLILSYPFKKDQPMETYLSAKVAFLLKPHTRVWEPGQGETTIVITAPKKTDEIRTKGLSEEEALHRLGYTIWGFCTWQVDDFCRFFFLFKQAVVEFQIFAG